MIIAMLTQIIKLAKSVYTSHLTMLIYSAYLNIVIELFLLFFRNKYAFNDKSIPRAILPVSKLPRW